MKLNKHEKKELQILFEVMSENRNRTNQQTMLDYESDYVKEEVKRRFDRYMRGEKLKKLNEL